MEKKVFLLVLFCIVFLLGVGSVTAGGCDNGTHEYVCGETVYESCTMNDDLNVTGTCFIIGADGVVIDGNGFSLNGRKDLTDYDYGISISNKENITVKNIIISNFHNAINIASSNKVNIINSTLIYNDQWGVFLDTSSNSLVENCFIAHVYNQLLPCGGLFIYGGEKNVIKDNYFTNNSGLSHHAAVHIKYSEYNNVTDNMIEHAIGWGVNSWHSNFTRIESNYMNDIKPAGGVYVHGNSFNCSVINNTLYNGGGMFFHTNIAIESGHLIKGNNIINGVSGDDKGIELIRTHGVIITDNYIKNYPIGIRFYGSFNCELRDSQIYNSSIVDVASKTITYEPNNTLINTTFTSSNVEDGTLYVKWYMDVFVNLRGLPAPPGATVNAYDINNNLYFSEETDSDGYLTRQNVTEYYETNAGKTYLTEYSVNATKDGYASQWTEYINLTTNFIDKNRIVLKIRRAPN